ncbi:hypothetical protein CLV47_12244 [Antricoccus suffuscus]|uniref:Uncharacterized protein n=1 Tax=Antricoccus suffuscus TaxID=1629062 RepID=A0A2T0ZGB2_9ACTN|nr:hypothetical protein CLV47_12244 [Antricoccus suffuscus]
MLVGVSGVVALVLLGASDVDVLARLSVEPEEPFVVPVPAPAFIPLDTLASTDVPPPLAHPAANIVIATMDVTSAMRLDILD